MKKKDILKSLKARCNNDLKLPSQLGMEIVQERLIITLQGDATITNMQADGAAFEGWALVLKRWIPEIEKVSVKWTKPSTEKALELQHYQRFLYRVKRFASVFPWFVLNKGCSILLSDLEIDADHSFILNTPNAKRSRAYKTQKELYTYSESELEEFILSNADVSAKFMQSFNLTLVDNQLPVGVFKDTKSNATKVFTGGKSAIDIWGITTDGNCCIFELKNSKNRKVGALTEMLFYSFVIQDIIQGVFEFDALEYPGLQEITKAKKVTCYLLAPSTHPLIDSGVFSLLNNAKSKMDFANVKLTDDFNFKVQK